jgi:hypothetical protein
MNIQERNKDQHKNYRPTNTQLDSKNQMILELESLLERVNNRIKEHSNYIRFRVKSKSEKDVQLMNLLKFYRSKVGKRIDKLRLTKDQEWRSMRGKAQEIFDKTDRLLQLI